jgi:ubiquinone/menaquinone biosynthesis C-methylase UbiE
VQGIDPSESMIREAVQADTYGRYELLVGDFPWPDNTFDGVMSNWVFPDIGSVAQMDIAAREIYRVLRPGGPFVMLVNNEEYVGKRTSTYQNGQPDKTYGPGDDILVTYFKNGEQRIQFKDYFWPTETYSSVIGRAGFREVRSYVPRLNPRTIEEIEFLKSQDFFPNVDYQALVNENPRVIIVGKK